MITTVHLAVNGTLMRGLELNGNLLEVGASFVREAHTEPAYKLWSIGDRHPAMMRVKTGGVAIALEVWAVPPEGLSQILIKEPPGLCIGKVRLVDGEEVLGVLGEPILCEGQREITQWGGWRAYAAEVLGQSS
ncbi:MAG: glutamyl-tRNA amidotransferase [Coleofasciculaceae cyanobacterium SM2_3_26]|nr:glutamyl-tRNA amidotransferase [Coleofasciculaceae cyanobacterium SM2_3_26]